MKLKYGLLLTLCVGLLGGTTWALFEDVSGVYDQLRVEILHQRGIFGGIDGEARLDETILKSHAVGFLMKLTETEGNLETAVSLGIIDEVPPDDAVLTKAEWLTLLHRAYDLAPAEAGAPWYSAGVATARRLGLWTPREEVTEVATRKFVVRTAWGVDTAYGQHENRETLQEIEQVAMRVRDLVLDEAGDSEVVEVMIWDGIHRLKTVTLSNRSLALVDIFQAQLLMLKLREEPDHVLAYRWRASAQRLLDEAQVQLPAAEGFISDMRAALKE